MPDNEHGRGWQGTAYQSAASQKVNGHAEYRLKIVNDDQIRLTQECSYTVKDILPDAGLACAWGPPGCGKTFWAYDLCMHIALGWPYRGHKVRQRPVLWIAAEGESGVPRRREAWRREHLAEDTSHIPFYWLLTRIAMPSDQVELVRAIGAAIGDLESPVIVDDTLNRTIEGSESTDEDMGAFIRAWDAVGETFKSVNLAIHHCGINEKRP